MVEPTHLKNLLVKLDHLFRVRGKNKKHLKPPTSSQDAHFNNFKFRWSFVSTPFIKLTFFSSTWIIFYHPLGTSHCLQISQTTWTTNQKSCSPTFKGFVTAACAFEKTPSCPVDMDMAGNGPASLFFLGETRRCFFDAFFVGFQKTVHPMIVLGGWVDTYGCCGGRDVF